MPFAVPHRFLSLSAEAVRRGALFLTEAVIALGIVLWMGLVLIEMAASYLAWRVNGANEKIDEAQERIRNGSKE